MANYGVTITMPETTAVWMHEQGFQLYAFKAVQVGGGGGKPLVWFASDIYSVNTEFMWEVVYQAYSSQSAIVPGGRIQASASYPADLGQKFTVTNAAGTGTVTRDGLEGRIMITSTVLEREFACGISQKRDGKFAPLCALPLDYGLTDLFTPVEKVLLMFSTAAKDLGTVVVQAFSDGVFITLTGTEPKRQVSYEKGKGWNWGGGSWGTPVSAGADLVRLLIEPSRKLELARMDASPLLAAVAGEDRG